MNNRADLRILILQHPAETRRPHGTAHLILENYKDAKLKRGLAWSNLNKAWGQPQNPDFSPSRPKSNPLPFGTRRGQTPNGTNRSLTPSRWGVLYAGGRAELAAVASQEEPGFYRMGREGDLDLVNGEDFEGIILIDGTWKEAKTLWWRNAWLTRLQRLVLVEEPVTGIRLRRSTQKTALSTVECAAYGLKYLSKTPETAELLIEAFRQQTNSGTTSVAPLLSPPLSPALHPNPPLL